MVSTGMVDDRRMRRLKSDSTRLLFFYLCLCCDDYGKMYADPIDIKANMFPISKLQVKDVEKMLLDLGTNNLVLFYKCKESTEYMLEVNGWVKTNLIREERRKPSEIPDFNDKKHELIEGTGEVAIVVAKPIKVDKTKHLDCVYLTDKEYFSLTKNQFNGNESLTIKAIEILNNYKMSSGRTYDSDVHAIRGWVVDRMKKDYKKINRENKHLNIIEWAE